MHSRLRGLRCALTGAIALAGVATSLICSAQTTVSQSSSVLALTDTNWTTTLSVPQFSSSQGVLKSVVVTLNWTTFQSIDVANNDGANIDPNTGLTYANGMAEEVYADEGVNAQVVLQDGSTLTGAPPDMILGSQDMFGNAAGQILPNTSQSGGPVTTVGTTVSQTYTDSTNLALFTGAGTISFAASGNGLDTLQDSGGNVVWDTTTQAGASVTVTYTYGPPVTTTKGCIQGVVINNKSGDGRCGHATETGLGAGVTIDVYNAAGTLVGSAVTGKDGSYEVSGLLPNTTYTVKVVTSSLPKGYSLSCKSNSLSVNTPTTGCVTCVDFTAVKGNTGCSYNTFCQSDWNCTESCNNYNSCLRNYFCQVYPDGTCTVGGSNASCSFDSCSAIENCLVQSGNCGPLQRGCTTDPKSWSNCGTLCGETVACKLNCDFSDAGVFCNGFKNLTCQSGKFKGCTVSQVLSAANCYLNGDKTLPQVPHCSGQDLCTCLQSINSCYRNSGGWGGNSNGFCK